MENDNEFGGQFGKAPDLSDGDVDAALNRLSTRASRHERRKQAVFAGAMVAVVFVAAITAFAVTRKDNKVPAAADSTTSSTDSTPSSTSTSLQSTTSMTEAAATLSKDSVLTFDGLGPILVGKDISALKSDNPDLTIDVSATVGGDPKEQPCMYDVKSGNYLAATLYGGSTVSVIAIDPQTGVGIKTDKGIGIGSTLAEVRHQYPVGEDIDGGGLTWLVDSPTPNSDPSAINQLKFTLDNGKVMLIEAGVGISTEYCA